jgi:hypothetical protein
MQERNIVEPPGGRAGTSEVSASSERLNCPTSPEQIQIRVRRSISLVVYVDIIVV